MKNSIIIILLILIGQKAYSQDTIHQFQINRYQKKIIQYLDKEKKLFGQYAIDKEGIKIFASAEDKISSKAEFKIDWNELESFNNLLELANDSILKKIYKSGKYNYENCKKYFNDIVPQQIVNPEGLIKSLPPLPFLNYKIAIDAGHTAGSYAAGVVEMKYLNFKKDSTRGLYDSIQLAEGTLTFATAQLLKEKLEAQGAVVFLTRKKNGYTAFNKTLDDWLKDDYKKAIDSLYTAGKFTSEKKAWYLNAKRNKREKFSLIFKDLELAKRAEIINNFNPNFTVIIHFNVDETNTGWTKPGNKNFNMTFIGGAFMPSDLSSPEKRFEFLRMLLSTDLEESIKLSGTVVNSFEKTLNVKIAGATDATYLKEGCIATSVKGVYCRNLQLTRYIHSPLVYGETLYQDNINECKALNKEVDKTKNERIKQVAEAYYQGILNYIDIR